jgi:hypothetical protein
MLQMTSTRPQIVTKRGIERKVRDAVRRLSTGQPTLFSLSPETHQTEWNIAHHFANALAEIFEGYDCDVDMLKPTLESRRPDIVIHRRGTHKHNLLVVEVKRIKRNTRTDISKIREFWFGFPLRYRFGAIVVLDEHSDPNVKVIENVSHRRRPRKLRRSLSASPTATKRETMNSAGHRTRVRRP